MRTFPCVLIALATASPAAAQTRPQATLALTIFGGAIGGHTLWRVDRQPLELRGAAPNFVATGQYDTLTLVRTVGSSLLLGASATLYRSSHVGFQMELAYLSLPLENSCSGVFYNTDAENKNQQLCNNLAGTTFSASGIAAYLGLNLRAASRGAFSPYARAGFGLTSLSHSPTAVAGLFTSQGGVYVRDIILDPNPEKTSLSYLVGVGLTTPLGTGYQVRLELRDVLARLSRVDGPADDAGTAPTSTRTYHHLALSIGLDVVLEQKRGRRY